jgi:hypothetical protein
MKQLLRLKVYLELTLRSSLFFLSLLMLSLIQASSIVSTLAEVDNLPSGLSSLSST